MGPNSRALLQKVSRADFSNEGFPFATIREVGIGHATVLASRRTYMGELGWELYVPVEFAVTVFETLHEAGAEFGLRDAGYYAVEMLAAGEGLSRLGPRAHARRHAVPGGPRLGGEARQAGRLHRPARRWSRPRASRWRAAWSRWCWRMASRCCGAARRCCATASRSAISPRRATAIRSARRSGLGYVKRGDGAAIDAAWLEAAKFEVDLAGTRLKAKLSLRCPTIPPARASRAEPP